MNEATRPAEPRPAEAQGDTAVFQALHAELLAVRERVRAGTGRWPVREGPPGDALSSRVNLAHYLALRGLDLRALQDRLAEVGLSSLGRCEAHVLASLSQVLHLLGRLLQRPDPAPGLDGAADFRSGNRSLIQRADRLLGEGGSGHGVRIMVTLPGEAAEDPALLRQLIEAGMQCARINCAHDGPEAWRAMVRHLREAEVASGRPCRLLMDLPGFKLRTGPLGEGPSVLHLRPQRDALGRVVAPGRWPVTAWQQGQVPAGRLPLPASVCARLQPGDRLVSRDTRDKRRVFELQQEAGAWWALGRAASYLTEGSPLRLERHLAGRWERLAEWTLRGLPARPGRLRLQVGDRLLLRPDQEPGGWAEDADGRLAVIGCSLPQVLAALRPGQPVWIDDGRLGGRVDQVSRDGALLHITQAPRGGANLRADKGLNFPETELDLPGLSPQDLAVLDQVLEDADLIGYSFVESAGDMECLMRELGRRGRSDIGILAKIETRRAVRNLPEILFAALGRHPLGVMIARGDLAVELGGERLAEIQEEILWLCEAAHVPAVWATQVLETLTKKGVISRPELTDAAMSGRAECVMLNKGPHVVDAVRTLDDILTRMQAHQYKKGARLRALHW